MPSFENDQNLPLKYDGKGDPSYKNEVLQQSTQCGDFRACHFVKHPHLPYYT